MYFLHLIPVRDPNYKSDDVGGFEAQTGRLKR